MTTEEKYMKRCIELARNALCTARPNPTVGAVIVCQDRIVGEGYHIRAGEGHAEVNAIRNVADPSLLPQSTIYVSLEPCSHYGKTPPCADLILEKGIPRIVVGCLDPFPQVAGRGIRKLQEAGRQVTVGVLEDECRHLIRRFTTFHLRQRPYITLKWAQSADGFIDRLRTEGGGGATVLSSPLTAMLTHRLRTTHSAIMVGARTAWLDNPSLTVRHWAGPQPVRVVTGSQPLPPTLHVFDTQAPTLHYPHQPLADTLADLHRRNLQSLLVEGGSRLLQAFIDQGLWDEIVVEQAPTALGSGVPAPHVPPGFACTCTSLFGHPYRHYRQADAY